MIKEFDHLTLRGCVR